MIESYLSDYREFLVDGQRVLCVLTTCSTFYFSGCSRWAMWRGSGQITCGSPSRERHRYPGEGISLAAPSLSTAPVNTSIGSAPSGSVLHPAETLPTSCRLRSASIQYRFSTSALRATLSTLVKAGTKSLNMNIRAGLLDRIDKFRFKRMFSTRSQAIEFLLEVALKLNPKKPKDRKSAGRKEDR